MKDSPTIYEFKCYKKFLIEYERSTSKRGFRTRLASAIRCQGAYVTQVLNGDSHFSLEQGEALGRFLVLGGKEIQYLILLLSHARAATSELKKHYDDLLKEKLAERKDLKYRLKMNMGLTKNDYQLYCSDWSYSAILALLTVEGQWDIPKIATKLRISEIQIREVTDFLLQKSLVEKYGQFFRATQNEIHIDGKSALIHQYHRNLRLFSAQYGKSTSLASFRYSGFLTCSEATLEKIQEEFSKLLEKSFSEVRTSPSEKLVYLGVDCWGVD